MANRLGVALGIWDCFIDLMVGGVYVTLWTDFKYRDGQDQATA